MNRNVQRLTGLVLILAGLASFMLNSERPITALIGPFVGVVILMLSIGLGRGRNTSYWSSLVLSLLFGLMCANMAIKSYSLEDSDAKTRRIVVFWSMGVATLGNAGYLLAKFKSSDSAE